MRSPLHWEGWDTVFDGREDQPAYLARVSIESLGTMQGLVFFGMPPIQSLIIPFALPEIVLYKHVRPERICPAAH